MADAAAAVPTRKLVLVVDDSPDMRGLIDDILSEEGYEVITAPSGGRALSLMAERLPDLVITDLFMPGMNGFTLRGEMLRRPDLARVPVIVLSAFWQRPSETLDVVDVLGKPLNLDRLLEVVNRVLAPVVGDESAPIATATPDQHTGGARATNTRSGKASHRRKADASGIQQEA